MASRKKPAAKKLPAEILVTLQDDGDGSYYLVANRNVKDFADGDVIGVYNLNATAKVSVRHELEFLTSQGE